MPTPSPRFILPILIGSYSLGLVASSIYTPSIPDMARNLGVPVGQVQLTFTVYLLAFAPAMLVIGPLSDRFGRRRILIAGILLCFAASVFCALAPNIEVLLAARALQAIGACAGMVIARAVVRDVFDRDRIARVMSTLASASTAIPILSPFIGGYLHIWLGWRANFGLLAIFSGIVLIVTALLLPETNRQLQNQASLLRGLVAGIAILARTRRFIGYALVVAGGGAAFYGFGAAGPVLLIDRYGVAPEHYAFYSFSATVGFVAGSFLSSRIVTGVGVDRLIWIGGGIISLAGVAMAVLSGYAVPSIVVPSLILLGVGAGFTMPNANTGSVNIHPHLAGAASGLAGFTQMIGAAAATVAFSSFEIETAVPLAVLYSLAALVTFIGIAMASLGPAAKPAA